MLVKQHQYFVPYTLIIRFLCSFPDKFQTNNHFISDFFQTNKFVFLDKIQTFTSAKLLLFFETHKFFSKKMQNYLIFRFKGIFKGKLATLYGKRCMKRKTEIDGCLILYVIKKTREKSSNRNST